MKGRQVWRSMTERNAEKVDHDKHGLGAIGGSCLAGHTYHPSWKGYSAGEWRPRVKRFLDTFAS